MCIFGYHGYHYSTQSWSGWKVWHLSFQTPYHKPLYDNWMHFYILAKFESFIPFLKKKMIFDASDYNWEMRYNFIEMIKIDWSGSMVLFKLEKEIDLFSIEIKLKSQKIDMSTLSFILILKIWHFYQCTGLDSW